MADDELARQNVGMGLPLFDEEEFERGVGEVRPVDPRGIVKNLRRGLDGAGVENRVDVIASPSDFIGDALRNGLLAGVGEGLDVADVSDHRRRGLAEGNRVDAGLTWNVKVIVDPEQGNLGRLLVGEEGDVLVAVAGEDLVEHRGGNLGLAIAGETVLGFERFQNRRVRVKGLNDVDQRRLRCGLRVGLSIAIKERFQILNGVESVRVIGFRERLAVAAFKCLATFQKQAMESGTVVEGIGRIILGAVKRLPGVDVGDAELFDE